MVEEQFEDLEAVKTQWGRIIACLPQLDSIDLIDLSLKVGRSEECDVVIHKPRFLPEQLLLISKVHFIISKDPEDIYVTYITDMSKNGTYVNNELIGKDKTIVLQNNDVIAIGNMVNIYVFKCMKWSVDENYLPPVLKQKYESSRLLGKGACGEVVLAYEKLTCKKYAIKKILKGRNSPSQINNINHPSKIQTEIDILQRLSHPLVVNMTEIVETDNEVFIVLEYVKGGELSRRISSLCSLTETNAKFLFYQIALAVQYLHSQGITHRDLKPCNILLSTDSPYTLIKVTDFGLSKISEGYDMQTVCGTFHYIAPEVLSRTIYDRQADMWSLGVILFYMLSKELPFQSKDRLTLGKRIITGSYSMRSPQWYEVSPAAQDLIKNMLTLDPKKRITIDEVLNHPWITTDNLMRFSVEKLLNVPENLEEAFEPEELRKRKIEQEQKLMKNIKRVRFSNGPR